MTYETIQYDITDNVARLTLNRPDRLNSMNVQMHAEIQSALDQAEHDGARCLVFTGAGRGFCAGQDLSDRVMTPGEEVDLGESLENRYNPLIRRLEALQFPIICGVNGVAAGAGVSLALAADIVIAAKSAKFIQAFAKIGLIPDAGGTWVLPRLIGQARALGLALTAEPLSAEKAADWGLIWKCVEDEELTQEIDLLAQSFAHGPTTGLAAIRHAIRSGADRTLTDHLDYERDEQRRLGKTLDYREGVDAFHNKRKPIFKGE